jgi:hypothetical protein
MAVKVIVTVGYRQVGRPADKIPGKEGEERKRCPGTNRIQGSGQIEQKPGSQKMEAPGPDEETNGLDGIGRHG